MCLPYPLPPFSALSDPTYQRGNKGGKTSGRFKVPPKDQITPPCLSAQIGGLSSVGTMLLDALVMAAYASNAAPGQNELGVGGQLDCSFGDARCIVMLAHRVATFLSHFYSRKLRFSTSISLSEKEPWTPQCCLLTCVSVQPSAVSLLALGISSLQSSANEHARSGHIFGTISDNLYKSQVI